MILAQTEQKRVELQQILKTREGLNPFLMKKTCQEKAEDRAGYGSGQAQERNRNILGEPGLWV